MTIDLPRSSSQNLQFSEYPAESIVQNGVRETKDPIPWAMSVRLNSSGILDYPFTSSPQLETPDQDYWILTSVAETPV